MDYKMNIISVNGNKENLISTSNSNYKRMIKVIKKTWKKWNFVNMLNIQVQVGGMLSPSMLKLYYELLKQIQKI